MPREIYVRELSTSTVTRARGGEAFATLQPMLEQGPVEILLDGVDLLSASFLDELLRLLIASSASDKVTFVTGKQATLGKLARVSAIRGGAVYARQPTTAVRSAVSPRTFKSAPRLSRSRALA